MSQPEPAEIGYRLQPADVVDRVQTFTISAVSVEGLESMQPVAHFQETRKKLLLSPEHCRSLILLTGSSLFHDWVGTRIRITAARAGGYATIRILPEPEAWPWALRLRRWIGRAGQLPRPPKIPVPRSAPAWIEAYAKPILVIGLLSVVSFLLARAYGADLLDQISVWFGGS